MNINPLTAITSLEKTNKSAKFETLKPFSFLFRTVSHVQEFSSKRVALKRDIRYKTGKTYCFWGASVPLSARKFYTMGQVKGLIWFYSFKGEKRKFPPNREFPVLQCRFMILRLAYLKMTGQLRLGVLLIKGPALLGNAHFVLVWQPSGTCLWKQCELTSNVVELQFLNLLTRTAIWLLFFSSHLER